MDRAYLLSQAARHGRAVALPARWWNDCTPEYRGEVRGLQNRIARLERLLRTHHHCELPTLQKLKKVEWTLGYSWAGSSDWVEDDRVSFAEAAYENLSETDKRRFRRRINLNDTY